MGKFKEYWDKLEQVVLAHPKRKPLDKEGRFYPDPTPHAPPPGNSFVADIDMFEVMRNRLRAEGIIRQQFDDDETMEEANDFEVDDETEPFSPHEEILEQLRPDGPHRLPTYVEVNHAISREMQADATLNARQSAADAKRAAEPPAPKPEPKAPESPLPEAKK